MSVASAVAVDGGDLTLGEGLLSLLRPALACADVGAVVALASRDPALRDDLPRWCRVEHHDYLSRETRADGVDVHLVRRGLYPEFRGAAEHDSHLAPHADGRVTSADLLKLVPFPESAPPTSGFAPRGAQVEVGGPAYAYTLAERARVAPPEVAKLYDQAVRGQWDGQTAIPWAKLPQLPLALERAVGQIMTFLAENELSALYLPSRFIAAIHPAYAETAMFLATQLADEARHIDVFMKRARLGASGAGISSVVTSQSLLSLLETADFAEAAFLLSVLGEGTFLDLLKYIETNAPDDVTHEIMQRVYVDEARHVFFGVAHLRHALASDPTLYARLEAAVRRRASTLAGFTGAPAPVQDALTVLAARGTDPAAIRRGHTAYRELLETMHTGRMKRLEQAGFTPEQAQTLSDLHTPNFM